MRRELEHCEEIDPEDLGSNPAVERPMGAVIQARLTRRGLLQGAAGVALSAAVPTAASAVLARPARAELPGSLIFEEVPHGVDETHHVSPGYRSEVLIRWGDPVLGDAPAFDPRRQNAAAQAKQFGYNNDFVGYLPLPAGSQNAEHGLLLVNHEYTNAELMFPGVTAKNKREVLDREQTEVELAAHGASIIEVARRGGRWQVLAGSAFARRLTGSTPMLLSGPAAGHARLKTKADPSGRRVLGMLNNCAGGLTPWGTVLTAEENFNGYFGGDAAALDDPENYTRYGISANSWYAWWRHHRRFDVAQEPNEPNRFGWLVEIDPYDPNSRPVKRTALGRFKHEGAGVVIDPDGRVVVYSGDDERFEYLYKFVSSGRYDPNDRAANGRLLDSGTLYAARFHEDGTVAWLPLSFGSGPLTPENGFDSQAEVLIFARRAADLLGATPMDRPEDVDVSPLSGKAYVMLTNNTKRPAGETDAINPRGPNPFGHIVEIIPPERGGGRDHAALTHRWEVLLLAGDPGEPSHGARYHPAVSRNGWFAAPDNAAFDARGRLWISTDQGSGWRKTGTADGLYGCDVEGAGRALTRKLFRVPIGAELCGPAFTPDGRSLFLAVQHPAADGAGEGRNFDDPLTRWPDFDPDLPPRPSLVVVTREDGGEIGG